ncbi:type I restriction enzyme S subunit [Arthrobacter sp. V1I9]|uniref:restriction endonuclease subunit S n=1 Tax=Arthrobacter sp. V1I9 TaxID=3042275 RepID=UPI002792F926|nr:hypothetical protein [Arthrobacter sp. V1I9]MDQ0869165.1 type I restriction enzyme S subunit [Arthrobacter sp. V1I9]
MELISLAKFAEINPQVQLTKGQTAWFVSMDDVSPSKRDATPSETRAFGGGARFMSGDTLFARITPCLENGKIARALLARDGEVASGSTEFVVLRGREGVSDSLFVYYLMRHPDIREMAIGRMEGTSGRQRVPSGFFTDCRVPLWGIDDQRAIASVLGALDDKIAANTQVISKIDDLSHTVFRSMGSIDSRMIPLSGTAQFVNGKAFTKGASGHGRVVIRIAELNSGIGASTVYNDIDVEAQHVARPGDLLFAWSGSLTLHRWFRPEAIVNQHIFKVIPNAGYPYWLVYELLRHKLDQFKAIAADKATTMGHIQRKHLDEPVAVPAEETIRRHDELMTALWEKSLAAEVENLKLVETRDVLLPQLMSGNVRVKNAEKVLENAGV